MSTTEMKPSFNREDRQALRDEIARLEEELYFWLGQAVSPFTRRRLRELQHRRTHLRGLLQATSHAA